MTNTTQPNRRPNTTQTISLKQRVHQIDEAQGRRFAKLEGAPLEIATEGILRHLRACASLDVNADYSAIREIIDDALQGRSIFALEV